ncbi:hypothetical protein HUJ04_001491 [Dendroctonus ponderosae]
MNSAASTGKPGGSNSASESQESANSDRESNEFEIDNANDSPKKPTNFTDEMDNMFCNPQTQEISLPCGKPVKPLKSRIQNKQKLRKQNKTPRSKPVSKNVDVLQTTASRHDIINSYLKSIGLILQNLPVQKSIELLKEIDANLLHAYKESVTK